MVPFNTKEEKWVVLLYLFKASMMSMILLLMASIDADPLLGDSCSAKSKSSRALGNTWHLVRYKAKLSQTSFWFPHPYTVSKIRQSPMQLHLDQNVLLSASRFSLGFIILIEAIAHESWKTIILKLSNCFVNTLAMAVSIVWTQKNEESQACQRKDACAVPRKKNLNQKGLAKRKRCTRNMKPWTI